MANSWSIPSDSDLDDMPPAKGRIKKVVTTAAVTLVPASYFILSRLPDGTWEQIRPMIQVVATLVANGR